MLAARQRASLLARQIQRTTRSYASHSHGHHAPAPKDESFGKGSMFFVATFFGTVLFYQFTPKEGENSAITNLINKYRSKAEDWAEINAVHTKAMEQAGYDRNLFENASSKHRYVDIAYPEAFTSHAPRNVQAGQLISLDHVVEHYRQQHIKDEERKAAKLTAQKA
ncbi:NADH-ubiquinone oxidoreductase 17.8 kDa subunit [Escovopsis weberi]|uniref:NADH-ubiquinone oxidoreductase 17.8 kDa subunit n=1 Tax=Escovopsis weberi TaxID=150374 RepID=A0A0M8N3Q7_ESCWE|nr:NADH-ubiquinone oxidoreductase 17.8 kDa subunit [Escovopsis weberi]